MQQFLILSLCLFGLWLHSSQAAIQPAKDTRSFFAAEFYRCVVRDLEKEEQNIVVSPAAAQKLLTTIFKGMERRQADRMLFDYGVKHVDMKRLREEVEKETGMSDIARSPEFGRRQMRELAEVIEKDVVTKYFEDDFSETNDLIKYENFIVTRTGLNAKTDYKDFAKNYFNTHVIDGDSTDAEQIKTKSCDKYQSPENVDIYSDIEVKTKIKDSYTLPNGNINAVVEALYREDDDRQYIVLPLVGGLKMLVVTAAKPYAFNFFITQIIGRRMTDLEEYKKDDWKTEIVLVHLPTLKFENINDLTVHFRKVTREGLKQALSNDAKMTEAFENWNGGKIERFLQRVSAEIASEDKTDAIKGPHTKTFDATGKNFFYAIYNDRDFYLMGHHITAV